MNKQSTVSASLGNNRTGIVSSEGRAEAMQQGSEMFTPTSHGAPDGPGLVRVLYAKESSALGSVPQPGGVVNKAKHALNELQGANPTLLMDKLGERLSFERTGTRLYAALISKHEAFGEFDGGPTRAELVAILEEEHGHFSLLEDAIRRLGGDPTAITPSANVASTAAIGVQQVLTDPRTTLLQSLEAILIAELTDYEGWYTLTTLTRLAGEHELALLFEEAEHREAEHLRCVRLWIEAGHGMDQWRAAE